METSKETDNCNVTVAEKAVIISNSKGGDYHENTMEEVKTTVNNECEAASSSSTLEDTACSNLKNLGINDSNMNKDDRSHSSEQQQQQNNEAANSKRLLGLSALLDYGDTTSSDESVNNDEDNLIMNKDTGAGTFRINNQNSSSSSSSSFSHSNASQFSSSSSSSSSDSEDDVGATSIEGGKSEEQPVQTKGELSLDDLPPIEDLNISVAEEECVQMGVVSSIVDRLVMIESLPGQPAFDIDTVLFMDKGNIPLGMVHDVFGQVTRPMYVVRFNSRDQIAKKNVVPGTPIYAAPKTKHSAFVFIKELLKMRGSDASWLDGNEPPEAFLDFSDDEQEVKARRRRTRRRTETDHPGKRKMNSKERHESFVRKMNSKNLQESEKYKKAPERYEPEAKRYMPGVHMINSPVRPYRFDLGAGGGAAAVAAAAGGFPLPPMPVFPAYGFPPPGNMSAFGGGAAFNSAIPPPSPWSLRPPPSAAGFHHHHHHHPHRIPLTAGCVPMAAVPWMRTAAPGAAPAPPPPQVLYQSYPGQSQPMQPPPPPIRGAQFRSFGFHGQWGLAQAPPPPPPQGGGGGGGSPETRGRSRNRTPMDRHTRIS